MRFAALICLLLSTCEATAAVNWPQFRGPRGDGMSDETGLPVEWSESSHVAWKTPIHGKGWSSPVVWNDQIWLTTAPADGRQLSAVCVDRRTGRVLQDRVVFEIAEPQFCHEMNSYASPTPVIEKTTSSLRPCSARVRCSRSV